MTIKILQDSAAIDRSHWRWSVWLDAPSDELEQIEDVVWKLHPTFSPSEVRVNSRETGFRLKSEGWDEFEIQAEIHRTNRPAQSIRHWLRFGEAQAAPRGMSHAFEAAHDAAIAKRPFKIFLSYMRSGARLAGMLCEQLRQRGYVVFIDVDILPGEDWMRWLEEKLFESDLVVLLLGDSSSESQIVRRYEVELAQNVRVPIIVATVGESKVPPLLADAKCVRISGVDHDDVKLIVQRIKEAIN